MLAILPVLALQMQLTQAEVEQALVDGVREKLALGWSIADVRGEEDELVITITRGIAIERHIAHIDDEDASASGVRIDKGGTISRDFIAPGTFLVDAIKHGGVEIDSDCGSIVARPYMVDAKAKGAAARKLVAETLKSSDDLERAELEGNHAMFAVELRGSFAELHVTLDGDRVVGAELRRYMFGPDMTTHAQHAKMKRRLGASVQTIEDGVMGPVLVGTTRRFAIDFATFENNNPDDHSCGC